MRILEEQEHLKFRVLGLSATPGSTGRAIQNVPIPNIYIHIYIQLDPTLHIS